MPHWPRVNRSMVCCAAVILTSRPEPKPHSQPRLVRATCALAPGRLGVLLLLLACAARASAQEDDTARAKERFEHGVAEYEAGRFTEALDDFQEAYRLKPHPLVRVNIANCYDKLDRPVEASFHFELFLASKQGSDEQRDEIKEALKLLRKRIGKLVLSVSPDGARVTLDGSEERRAPIMEPITLRAGQHEIAVSLEGFDTLRRSVDVKAESSTEVSLRLTRPEVAAAPEPLPEPPLTAEPGAASAEQAPATDAQPEPQAELEAPPAQATQSDDASMRGGIPKGVWIAGGVSLALVVGGTITGLLAGAAEQNFDDNLKARFDPALTSAQQQIAWNQANDAADRATLLAVSTDVLFGGAIISAGIAVYLYITRADSSSGDAPQARLTLQGRQPTLQIAF